MTPPPVGAPPPAGDPPPPRGGSVWARFAVLGASNLLVAGLGFAATLVTARAFGAEGLGLVSLALSIQGFGGVLTLFGTDLLAIRAVAAHPAALRPMMRAATRLRLALSLLAYPGVLAAAWLVPAFRDAAPLVAVAGLSSFAVALSVEWAPQALRRTGVTALANLALQAINLAALAAVALGGGPLWGVLAAKVTADLLVALGYRVWAARLPDPLPDPGGGAPGGPPPAEASGPLAAARAAWPICATQLVRTLALSSDLLLLSAFVGAAALGHYAAAFRLFYVMMSVANAYFVVMMPRIFAAAARPHPALAGELRASLRRTLPLAALGVVLLALASPLVMGLMFGAGFREAAPALALLGAATAVSLVGRHYRQVLLARRRQVDDLRNSAAGAAVHLLAKLALIPLLGITGAALGTLLGESAILLIQRRAAARELEG